MKPAILLAIFSFIHAIIFCFSGDENVFWLSFLLTIAATFNLARLEDRQKINYK